MFTFLAFDTMSLQGPMKVMGSTPVGRTQIFSELK